ncbi:MAG: 50S ribosomal protein L16 [Brevinemataceae bacterium]
MLMPSKVKYRKQHRPKINNSPTHDGDMVSFGDYGMVALEAAWISNRQIESARIAVNRYLKRGAKVWIRIFPDRPYTSKGEGVRMGKGKGSPDGWVAPVRPGKVMFEVTGVDEAKAKEAFRLAGHKLPIKVKFVKRIEG